MGIGCLRQNGPGAAKAQKRKAKQQRHEAAQQGRAGMQYRHQICRQKAGEPRLSLTRELDLRSSRVASRQDA